MRNEWVRIRIGSGVLTIMLVGDANEKKQVDERFLGIAPAEHETLPQKSRTRGRSCQRRVLNNVKETKRGTAKTVELPKRRCHCLRKKVKLTQKVKRDTVKDSSEKQTAERVGNYADSAADVAGEIEE